VLAGITKRMEEVGLRLHPDKTHIAYFRDGRRRGDHEHTSFTYLGFTFRARGARNRKDGSVFTSFIPAMSTEALKAKSAELRGMRIYRRTTLTLGELARWLNPIVSGWIQYYGQFYRSAVYPLLQRSNTYLRRWAGRKYQRLRLSSGSRGGGTRCSSEHPASSPSGSGFARSERWVRRAG
jgi:hypothetical protein